MGKANAAELAPDTVVAGRYRVTRLLGRGGMGAVYEAFEESIERRVALKVLHPIIALEAQVAARFLEEARLANRVRHPAIVEVTDYGTYEGRPFLVMELLDGESLGSRMEREGTFEPAAAVALLRPVFDAVAYLHERGVVHRDLKPDNVFLARVGNDVVPRILDLGIAKARAEGQSLTATDTMLGTPAYMAPEQVRSSRSVTPKADQYALGCVVYEMLTGRMPLEADNLHGILVAKVTEDPVPITTWRPALPRALCDAVMRAVARDPAARFADLPSFLAALDASLLAPTEPPPPAQPTPAPRVVAAEPAPRELPSQPAPRARVVAVVVVSASVALFGALALRSRASVEAPAHATSRTLPSVVAPAAHAPASPALASPAPAAPRVLDASLVRADDAAAAASVAAPHDAGATARRHHGRERHARPSNGRLELDARNPLRQGRP